MPRPNSCRARPDLEELEGHHGDTSSSQETGAGVLGGTLLWRYILATTSKKTMGMHAAWGGTHHVDGHDSGASRGGTGGGTTVGGGRVRIPAGRRARGRVARRARLARGGLGDGGVGGLGAGGGLSRRAVGRVAAGGLAAGGRGLGGAGRLAGRLAGRGVVGGAGGGRGIRRRSRGLDEVRLVREEMERDQTRKTKVMPVGCFYLRWGGEER